MKNLAETRVGAPIGEKETIVYDLYDKVLAVDALIPKQGRSEITLNMGGNWYPGTEAVQTPVYKGADITTEDGTRVFVGFREFKFLFWPLHRPWALVVVMEKGKSEEQFFFDENGASEFCNHRTVGHGASGTWSYDIPAPFAQRMINKAVEVVQDAYK